MQTWHQAWWWQSMQRLRHRSFFFACCGLLALAGLIWLLRNSTTSPLLWLPLSVTACLTAGQWGMLYVHGTAAEKSGPGILWRLSWLVLTVMHGALWGVNLLPLLHQVQGGFLLLGVAVSGAWALAPHPLAAVIFSCAVTLPPMAQFALGLNAPSQIPPLAPALLLLALLGTILSGFCLALWRHTTTLYSELKQTRTDHDNLLQQQEQTRADAERLTKITMLDALTGISNRRHCDEFIAREWRRARRNQSPLSLIYIDIDHFKELNDHQGHAAGDECLCTVARTIARIGRRGGDFAARYGGEEFVVVLAETGLEQASLVAERMRSEINALQIPHPGNPPYGNLTISLGVSTATPGDNASIKALMQQADRALYRAKHHGRNCVVQG